MSPAPSGAAAPAVADDAKDQRDTFASMGERLIALRADLEVVAYVLPAGSAAGITLTRARHQLAELATIAALRASL